jgi:hypothetical protein
VATFVIETYLSRARSADLDRQAADLRAAAERVRAVDPSVTHIRSYFAADDEVAYHIIEAGSQDSVGEMARAAGLVADRIVQAASG